MATRLRILCWNIAEASLTGALRMDSLVSQLAEHIRMKNPDLVLLSEVRRPYPFIAGRIDQTERLSRWSGLPHYEFGKTVRTGLTGHKGVSVLSRYPLTNPRMHPVMRGRRTTAYGTLEVTVHVEGMEHRIFSTRFDAHNREDNAAGHEQAAAMLRQLNPQLPVIFGGDLNARPSKDPQFNRFKETSGLIYTADERLDPNTWDSDPLDHLFYRGPYQVTQHELRAPWDPQRMLSDHPWVFVELERQPTG